MSSQDAEIPALEEVVGTADAVRNDVVARLMDQMPLEITLRQSGRKIKAMIRQTNNRVVRNELQVKLVNSMFVVTLRIPYSGITAVTAEVYDLSRSGELS